MKIKENDEFVKNTRNTFFVNVRIRIRIENQINKFVFNYRTSFSSSSTFFSLPEKKGNGKENPRHYTVSRTFNYYPRAIWEAMEIWK